MATAFQQDAFQFDAFQIEGGAVSAAFTADAVLLAIQGGSLTADAVIAAVATTIEDSFTGDAELQINEIFDDFNRASLGSHYTNVLNATIIDNELVMPAGDWGELERIDRVQGLPTTITFDFWVPTVDDGYHGYQVEAAAVNAYVYVDNLGGAPGLWGMYIGNQEHTFTPANNTWYRVKAYFVSGAIGAPWYGKVWKRDDPEPLAWQITYSNASTRAAQSSHYIYFDADGATYPSKIDNLSIDNGVHGVFRADAYISDGGPIVQESSFTADAVIVRFIITAPLDTDASPFTSLVQSTGSAETFTGTNWQTGGGLSRKTRQYPSAPALASPIFVGYDFFVPSDPTVGGHYWEIRFLTTWFKIDSWPYGDTGALAGKFEFGTRNNDDLYFDVTPSTWYRLFVRWDGVTGGKLEVWIWPRDQAIPTTPLFDITLTTITTLALTNNDSIQIYGYQASPDIVKMDNALAYSFKLTPSVAFTANSVLKKTTSGTFTANAVIYDPDIEPIEGSFTADAALLKTYAPSGSSNVATTATGTQTAVAGATGITVTYKSGAVNLPSVAFVSISLDLIGSTIPDITPTDSTWQQVASVNDGTNHALITWSRWVQSGDPDTATFSWTGARDAVGVGWTTGISPSTGASVLYDVYTAQGGAISGTRTVTDAFVADPAAMAIPRKWSQYAVFAADSNTTITIANPSGGGFVYIGSATQATNAALRAARDDFNGRTTSIYPLMTGFTSSAEPRLSHLIVVYEYGTYFTADAFLKDVNSRTFTANAYLELLPVHKFTADAVKLRTESRTFTANAVISMLGTGTFTADSVVKASQSTDNPLAFSAKAVLTGVLLSPDDDRPRLAKTVSMSVLQRRPIEFSAYIPPKVPDQEEEDPEPEPYCLPPCAPVGAGGSTNGWGAFKVSLTKCSTCGVYFRSDSEYLGRGSAGLESAEHCGYCGSHTRDNHVTKLWVNYPSIPEDQFLLRAKLTWDVNGPDSIVVKVYNADAFPDTEAEGCEDSPAFDDEWSGGKYVGAFQFINDASIGAYVLLGNTQYKYQEDPSTLTIDGSSLATTVLRFELDDETQHYNAKFRASNMEWPT